MIKNLTATIIQFFDTLVLEVWSLKAKISSLKSIIKAIDQCQWKKNSRNNSWIKLNSNKVYTLINVKLGKFQM